MPLLASGDDREVEPEPLITRRELAGTLFLIADIALEVQPIRELLEGGEEETSEDDA